MVASPGRLGGDGGVAGSFGKGCGKPGLFWRGVALLVRLVAGGGMPGSFRRGWFGRCMEISEISISCSGEIKDRVILVKT